MKGSRVMQFMTLKNRLREFASGILSDPQVGSGQGIGDAPHSFLTPELPPGARQYLTSQNPRLIELKKRYKGHPATLHSLWTDTYLQAELDLSTFRSDNAYVWQTRQLDANLVAQYLLTTYYVRDVDKLDLLNRLQEDGQFGAVNFSFNGQYVVSRDLLDSVLEINFLERHLRISQAPSLVVLDIGAGYGRFAYRLASALPNVKTIYCADAVAESTFLCDYYLGFRGVDSRAKAVPIDAIEDVLSHDHIDVVTNMESFAECTVESIRWWIDLVQRNRASYFMIVVEGNTLLSREGDGSKNPFQSLLEERDFDLMAAEPIYPSAAGVSKYGLYPSRTYFLFRNRAVVDKPKSHIPKAHP